MKRYPTELMRIGGSIVLATLLSCTSMTASAADLTVAALESWLARYGAAWETRDAAAAGGLFTIRAIPRVAI